MKRSHLLRSILIPIAAVTALAAAAPASAQAGGPDEDGGFDNRGVDQHDRTPDWNYRRGEATGKGAYYDGGRYGPRGLLNSDTALHPWLSAPAASALAAGRSPARANRRFVRLADRNHDARLTDTEIALALATIATRAR